MFPAERNNSRQSVMAHIEDSRQPAWEMAPIRTQRHLPRRLGGISWREATFVAALAASASVIVLALQRRGPMPRQARTLPSFAPADRTLAAASPAVLGATPERR